MLGESFDPTIVEHLHGEWRADRAGVPMCQVCGTGWPADQGRDWARSHWEAHVGEPAASDGFQITWYGHPAGTTGKLVTRASIGAFLAEAMGATYLRPELPVPRLVVVQQFVDQGELVLGMGTGFDWPRFEVTADIYRMACTHLIAAGLAVRGADPDWVISLFFRRAERLAVERGTDAHHEVRRMTILGEAAALLAGFPGLDDGVVNALKGRRAQAQAYDFDQPLDAYWYSHEPDDGPSLDAPDGAIRGGT